MRAQADLPTKLVDRIRQWIRMLTKEKNHIRFLDVWVENGVEERPIVAGGYRWINGLLVPIGPGIFEFSIFWSFYHGLQPTTDVAQPSPPSGLSK